MLLDCLFAVSHKTFYFICLLISEALNRYSLSIYFSVKYTVDIYLLINIYSICKYAI